MGEPLALQPMGMFPPWLFDEGIAALNTLCLLAVTLFLLG
jgi:hypothetical protein